MTEETGRLEYRFTTLESAITLGSALPPDGGPARG